MKPSSFTQEIADRICEELIEGRSMRQICSDEGMPNRSTVLRWMDQNPEFAAKCARAREMQADLMDDIILEVAHNVTPESAAADRVRLSAYQWRAAKLLPKKYGDRVQTEVTGADGGPVQVETPTDNDLARRIAFVLAKATKA